MIPELQAITGDAAKIKAEDIISRVTYTRDNLIFKLKNVLKACQTDIEVKLTHLKAIGNFENVREAYMTLFGPSAHTKSSEPYFMKAAYYYFTNDMVVSCGKKPSIVCNKEGQTINILPLSATSKTSWPCQKICNLSDEDVFNCIKNLFEDLLTLTHIDVGIYLSEMDTCLNRSEAITSKGHPLVCYAQPFMCGSKFLKISIIATHFPFLRKIKRN